MDERKIDEEKRFHGTKSELSSDFVRFIKKTETDQEQKSLQLDRRERNPYHKKDTNTQAAETEKRKGLYVKNKTEDAESRTERNICNFFNDKGLLKLAKLLSCDFMFQVWINMDMSKAQYDNIRKQYPSVEEGNLTLLQTALDEKPEDQKLNCLISALEEAGKKSLADKVKQIWSTGKKLENILTK